MTEILRKPTKYSFTFFNLLSSKLARVIFFSNFIGLGILLIGAFTLNELRVGLIDLRIREMRTQAQLLSRFLGGVATGDTIVPVLEKGRAREIFFQLHPSTSIRAQLYDNLGEKIADTKYHADKVFLEPLEPAKKIGPNLWNRVANFIHSFFRFILKVILPFSTHRSDLKRDPTGDVYAVLQGETLAGLRENDKGELIVTVGVPVQRVQAVVGAVILESHDVNSIISAERKGLLPVALVAVIVTLFSSLLITFSIVYPLNRLAQAALAVKKFGVYRRQNIPDFSVRQDEIGNLSQALQEMTRALYDRIDTIEKFSADVSHEIKNPLTSIHSAAETLLLNPEEKYRRKLLKIIHHDVQRLDRLITDISTYSRLDARLARNTESLFSLSGFLTEITESYNTVRTPEEARLFLELPLGQAVQKKQEAKTDFLIKGHPEALGQVLRNIIDNAKTFSPKKGKIWIRLEKQQIKGSDYAVIRLIDEGKGIPEENLKTIFNRFYTERPEDTVFGKHSGLGLSIAQQIIKAHHGEIWAENYTGDQQEILGACFVILLPFVQK